MKKLTRNFEFEINEQSIFEDAATSNVWSQKSKLSREMLESLDEDEGIDAISESTTRLKQEYKDSMYYFVLTNDVINLDDFSDNDITNLDKLFSLCNSLNRYCIVVSNNLLSRLIESAEDSKWYEIFSLDKNDQQNKYDSIYSILSTVQSKTIDIYTNESITSSDSCYFLKKIQMSNENMSLQLSASPEDEFAYSVNLEVKGQSPINVTSVHRTLKIQ